MVTKVLAYLVICSGSVCNYAVPEAEFASVEQCKNVAPIIAGMMMASSPVHKSWPADKRDLFFQCKSPETGRILFEYNSTPVTASR
ncbi:MAG: hypothetical protein ACPGO3_10940 [Magnetospiraceae bacterium]